MITEVDLVFCSSIAVEAARQAEEVFRSQNAGAALLSRDGISDREWKISYDQILEDVILGALSSNSSYPILSEESLSNTILEDLFWVVDPLDGSANCLRGLP